MYIVAAFGHDPTVHYKGVEGSLRDPVSEVDEAVEAMIRAGVDDAFPAHDVLGEESPERPTSDRAIVWAVDPIDGTSNFVNGFPLFCASIGLLHQGVPVVGAVWCASTHALRPGVYHARADGALCFDGEPLRRWSGLGSRRGLAGAPHAPETRGRWDVRKTGSAALECAFVAAGTLRLARFDQPNIWDVAGGIALALAAGCEVREGRGGAWRRFEGFADPRAGPDARVRREWRAPLLIGEPREIECFSAGP